MSNLQVLDIMYQAFQLALRLSMPFLLVSMAVGVLIAIFQAAHSHAHQQEGHGKSQGQLECLVHDVKHL